MSVPAIAASRLLLPSRARSAGSDTEECAPTLLALAAHIAELDGVEVVETSTNAQSCEMEAWIRPPEDAHGRRGTPLLLCRISRDTVEIHGLNPRDRHHLLSRRWGRLHGTGMQLFQPRNEHELEVCCFVLRRAYAGLLEAAANPAAARARDYWAFDLPRFSRTPLQ